MMRRCCLEVAAIALASFSALAQSGAGRAWRTGYDRSTMGAMLKRARIPIVADPRPAQHFFERSDNIAFAERGVPAPTLSSFKLHPDYHRPSDDLSRIDART